MYKYEMYDLTAFLLWIDSHHFEVNPCECKWIKIATNCYSVTIADAQQFYCSEMRENR